MNAADRISICVSPTLRSPPHSTFIFARALALITTGTRLSTPAVHSNWRFNSANRGINIGSAAACAPGYSAGWIRKSNS
jgi:hypothetical protein